jgi:hypothetical protein
MSDERLGYIAKTGGCACDRIITECVWEIRRLRDGWDEARSLLAKEKAEVERLKESLGGHLSQEKYLLEKLTRYEKAMKEWEVSAIPEWLEREIRAAREGKNDV